jgi:methylmalonyl-CoA mutase N-terminal domain/subunit
MRRSRTSRVDPAIEAQQAERLARLRVERDQQAVDSALATLKRAAEGEDNVLYPMKDALRARATVGEVCNALRDIWGAHRPLPTRGTRRHPAH